MTMQLKNQEEAPAFVIFFRATRVSSFLILVLSRVLISHPPAHTFLGAFGKMGTPMASVAAEHKRYYGRYLR
jgi:hypothetical protein